MNMNNRNRNRMIAVEQAATIYLFDSSDEEENILEKLENYAEETVANFSDRQFKQNFRLSPTTFEDLVRKVQVVIVENNRGGFPRTVLEKEIMISIWYLGNLESLRSVAERFGVSKSTCWEILNRICKLLLRVNTRFKIISWPSEERQREVGRHFRVNGFQGIIGSIDGCHIRIVAPKMYANSYINRKNYHSVLLQGVCDHKKLFTDVYAGEAGSIHDVTLFRRSDLYHKIINGEIPFYDDAHLIGDLAYKLQTYLIVGFKRSVVLTPRQLNFNKILSRKRSIIENSFALLKGRFRRLKFVETRRMNLISLFIVSGCILHNICILNGDLPDDILNLQEELEQIRAGQPDNFLDIDDEMQNHLAIIKRNNIANNLRID